MIMTEKTYSNTWRVQIMSDDFEYCKIMLEAYRDVLNQIIEGNNMGHLHNYIIEQIKFHVAWQEESK